MKTTFPPSVWLCSHQPMLCRQSFRAGTAVLPRGYSSPLPLVLQYPHGGTAVLLHEKYFAKRKFVAFYTNGGKQQSRCIEF